MRGVGRDHQDLPGPTVSCSDPTVNVADPRRMMKVSAYGCWWSLGPAPACVVDSRMIEMFASPGSSW